VSGGGCSEIADFSFYPDKVELGFQHGAHTTVQLADCEGGYAVVYWIGQVRDPVVRDLNQRAVYCIAAVD
jgi:hypothetical protein